MSQLYLFIFEGAPNVNILAPNNELNDARTKIKLEGKVLDKNCNPIGNAIVHAWYAGGNPGNFHLTLIKCTSKFTFILKP